MKKHLKKLIFVLVLSLILPNIAFGATNEEFTADINFFQDVLELIEENYPFEVKENDLIITGVKAMLKSLDPYSDYYTKEEAEKLYINLGEEFSGIGIYIEEKGRFVGVVSPIKGQPAEKAGIKEGDVIYAVDGKSIKNMSIDEVAGLIRGPISTPVKIKANRGKDYITFDIVREKIQVNPVEYEILDNKIGYISLSEFTSSSSREIKKALGELDKKNVKKLILDLRDNPGGYLDQAIAIGDLFVKKGPIVHVRDKENNIRTYHSSLEDLKYDLVLLVNEKSASASEILAGAIKDTK